MKKLKRNNGITLIALIITIIVMMILVGVTVNVALNGGLFDTTKRAAIQQEIATMQDIVSAQEAKILADKAQSGQTLTVTSQEILSSYGVTSPEVISMATEPEPEYVANELVPPTGTCYKLDPQVIGVDTTRGQGIINEGKVEDIFIIDSNKKVFYVKAATIETSVVPGVEENPVVPSEGQAPDALLDYIFGEADATGVRPGKNPYEIIEINQNDGSINLLEAPEELGQLISLATDTLGYGEVNNVFSMTCYLYFANINVEGVETKYKFKVKLDSTGGGTTIVDSGLKEITYDKNTRVGKYVEYDNKKWIILYDDKVNGIQMISENALLDENDQNIHIGHSDAIFSEEDFNINTIPNPTTGSEENYLRLAMHSYDNMVTRLNGICDGLVAEEEYVTGVRSVGTDPANPNDDNPNPFIGSSVIIPGYGELTWFEDRQYQLNLTKNVTADRTYYTIGDTDIEYTIKGADINYESDLDRMVALGINSTETDYWIASRLVECNPGYVSFEARFSSEGNTQGNRLWAVGPDVYHNGMIGYYSQNAVRPVVSLIPTTDFNGEGSETEPYNINNNLNIN